MEKTFRVGNNEFPGYLFYLFTYMTHFLCLIFQCDFSLSFSLCYPVHSTNVYGFTYRIKIFITQTYKSTYFFLVLCMITNLTRLIMNTKCPNKSQNLVETHCITIMIKSQIETWIIFSGIFTSAIQKLLIVLPKEEGEALKK